MLQRRTGLQRKVGLRQRTSPIKKISQKTKQRNEAYNPKREKFLLDNPVCQIQAEGCTYHSTCVHHSEGRGEESFMDVSTWFASCVSCNRACDKNHSWAVERGFIKSRHTRNGNQ